MESLLLFVGLFHPLRCAGLSRHSLARLRSRLVHGNCVLFDGHGLLPTDVSFRFGRGEDPCCSIATTPDSAEEVLSAILVEDQFGGRAHRKRHPLWCEYGYGFSRREVADGDEFAVRLLLNQVVASR
jgi:hypothetical protein